jgi:hypothetical protein
LDFYRGRRTKEHRKADHRAREVVDHHGHPPACARRLLRPDAGRPARAPARCAPSPWLEEGPSAPSPGSVRSPGICSPARPVSTGGIGREITGVRSPPSTERFVPSVWLTTTWRCRCWARRTSC